MKRFITLEVVASMLARNVTKDIARYNAIDLAEEVCWTMILLLLLTSTNSRSRYRKTLDGK